MTGTSSRDPLAGGSPWHASKLTRHQVAFLRRRGVSWASRRYALSRGHDGRDALTVLRAQLSWLRAEEAKAEAALAAAWVGVIPCAACGEDVVDAAPNAHVESGMVPCPDEPGGA